MFDDDPKEGLVMTMLRLGISRGEVRGEKVFEGMEISELTVGTSEYIIFFSSVSGLVLGLRPANERRYFVTTSLIGWTQI